MDNIREGNDVMVNWIILEDAETPMNTSGIYDESLYLQVFGKVINLPVFDRVDNTIRVEITPSLAPYIGGYRLVWRFTQTDPSYSQGDRRRAIDAEAFTIVGLSDKSADNHEITVVTVLKK